MLPTANPTPELMELGQPEPVCAVDHHHCGVGHVDAHFDHRRGHQNVQLAVPELAHDFVLFLPGHPTVEQAKE